MKICGVIAEYNPFHNGHKYQLAEARRLSGCDFLIAVMGGAFSQRGEVMLLDKWTRARMALQNGADLVVELPALFAVRSADMFALGGVRILSGLGADSICFGCETDDLPLLNRILDTLSEEDEFMKEALRTRLAQGQSHVRARGEALAERLGLSADLISQPNTALALEYMRANRTLAAPLSVYVVRRTGSYHAQSVTELASASAIRAAVYRGEIDSVRIAMPGSAFSLLLNVLPGHIADMSRLDSLLIDRLRSFPVEFLPDVGEGLENRVLKCAENAGSRESLLSSLKCKRYTWARLSRLLAHALLGLTSELTTRHPQPEYARLVGMRRDAGPLLKELKQRAVLPIVSDAVQLSGNEIFDLECRATDLRALQCDRKEDRRAGQEFTQKFVVI